MSLFNLLKNSYNCDSSPQNNLNHRHNRGAIITINSKEPSYDLDCLETNPIKKEIQNFLSKRPRLRLVSKLPVVLVCLFSPS